MRTNQGVVAIRELGYELVRVGLMCGADDALPGWQLGSDALQAVPNILSDGHSEQGRLLRHDADCRSQRWCVNVRQIDTVQVHRAALRK
jgi:hypothetical protein